MYLIEMRNWIELRNWMRFWVKKIGTCPNSKYLMLLSEHNQRHSDESLYISTRFIPKKTHLSWHENACYLLWARPIISTDRYNEAIFRSTQKPFPLRVHNIYATQRAYHLSNTKSYGSVAFTVVAMKIHWISIEYISPKCAINSLALHSCYIKDGGALIVVDNSTV